MLNLISEAACSLKKEQKLEIRINFHQRRFCTALCPWTPNVMLSSLLTFPSSCFLRLLIRRHSSWSDKSAMTSHVCAPDNVSLHLVCLMYFQLLFSGPLDSPRQSIFRCFLAEYPIDAHLKKLLSRAMLSASHRPKGFFSYCFSFHNLLAAILVLCKSCYGNKVLSQRKILLCLD